MNKLIDYMGRSNYITPADVQHVIADQHDQCIVVFTSGQSICVQGNSDTVMTKLGLMKQVVHYSGSLN